MINRSRVEELFHAAAELPLDQREEFLAVHCGDDAELREEVLSLLRANSAAGAFLDVPAHQHIPGVDQTIEGQRVGRYRIVRRVAIGGMGAVYEAVQDEPRRTVALKLLRQGNLDRRTIERFQLEGEVLGRLRHPGVAQVLEAGFSDLGGARPWIAMEFIAGGKNVVEFARDERLVFPAALDLFFDICAAVQHAHQNGVIHRDLKPSNILVDGEGRVKVIDFGVARLMDDERRAMLTEHGELVGTLQYMSPEQCGRDSDRVDVRTDVHALGLILYELVCGRRPYEVSGVPLSEAVYIVMEREPLRLAKVNPRLPGDVESVLCKALAKDPAERYPSVDAFCEDLRRLIRHEPVLARAPGPIHTLRLFTRRRPGIVASALLLVTATVVSVAFGVTAKRALHRAEFESNGRREMLDFVMDLFDRAEPDAAQGGDPTLSRILVGAVDELEQRLPNMPLAQAALLMRFAQVMQDRGKAAESLPLLDRVLQIRAHGDYSADTFTRSRLLRGRALRALGRIDEAKDDVEAAMVEFESSPFEAEKELLDCRIDLASIYSSLGRLDDAERTLSAVVEKSRRAETIGIALAGLGQLRLKQQQYEKAESDLLASVKHLENAEGRPTTRLAMTMNALGLALKLQGKYDAALPLYRRTRDDYRLLVPDDTSTLAKLDLNLGALLCSMEQWEEAESTLRSALVLSLPFHGHEAQLEARNQLLVLSIATSRWVAGELLGYEVLCLQRERGYAAGSIGLTQRRIARCLVGECRLEDAGRLYEEALDSLQGDPQFRAALIQTLREYDANRSEVGDHSRATAAYHRANELEEVAVAQLDTTGSGG